MVKRLQSPAGRIGKVHTVTNATTIVEAVDTDGSWTPPAGSAIPFYLNPGQSERFQSNGVDWLPINNGPKVVTWQGEHVTGKQYAPGAMSVDSGWLGIAEALTTDPLAPQPRGASSYLLPDSPTWQNFTLPGQVFSGILIQPDDEIMLISGMRVWLPEVGANINHTIYLSELRDGQRYVDWSLDISSTGSAGQWNNYAFPPRTATPAKLMEASLLTTKSSGPPNVFQYLWQYEGTSGATDPGTGKWTRQGDYSELYIHQEDDGGADRSILMDTMKPGDTIRVQEEQSSARYDVYTITAPYVKVGSYYQIPVIRGENGNTVRSGKKTDIEWTIESTIEPGPYVELLDYFSDTTEVKGFVDDSGAYTPTDNAYGVDIDVQFLDFSADWQLISAPLT